MPVRHRAHRCGNHDPEVVQVIGIHTFAEVCSISGALFVFGYAGYLAIRRELNLLI